MSDPQTETVGTHAQTPIWWRYRVRFGKAGPLRWTGHLDLQKSWERTFRRAGLAVAHSRGFHPHPKLVFASALPLGFFSEAELLDAWLEKPAHPDEALVRLRRVRQPGLEVLGFEPVDLIAPSLTSQLRSSVYTAHTQAGVLDAPVSRLLDEQHIARQRRGKPYDLRPLVEKLSWDATTATLAMQLACRPNATGRPEEVLDQLGVDARDCRICRKALLLEQT